MKPTSPWRPLAPSLFRKTPPEVRALDERRRETARKIEHRKAAFLATVNGLVLTSAAIAALAMAAAAAIWWR
ncbi:hypothetical protein CA606_14815 [Caulobacter vibrioides]|uniref:Uncharacterized protein n=1 Tax=Caulobacter vibrioides TaxID=155892 RepID=A0A290MWY9_CAUVI|nr:hypothetical protein [Caulobacter vibrioides]ATC33498.1 hypothetical protein CA606_14815 [Caulobacter vibrioides]